MGYVRAKPGRSRRRPRRVLRGRANGRRFFGFGGPQSFSITGSGGVEIGGTANLSTTVYGPGAAGRSVAAAPSRRVG